MIGLGRFGGSGWTASLAVLAGLASLVGSPAAAEEAPAPALQVQVFLGSDSLRPGGTVRGEIWIGNSSDQGISQAVLHLVAPDFLELLPGSCRGEALGRDLALGPIGPRGLLRRPLCLRARSHVREGDARLAFLVEYAWPRPRGGPARALASAEKQLFVGLFGPGQAGGVSLGLIALVLPGLLFFLVLRWRAVGWAEKLDNYQLITLSIVLSVLLQLLGPAGDEGLTSPLELLISCLLAAGLGLGAAEAWREWKAHRDRLLDTAIGDRDADEVVLRKLLRLHPGAVRPRAEVQCKDGSRLIGTLAAYAGEEAVIAGSFWLDLDGVRPRLEKKIREVAARDDLFDLADLAERKKLPLRVRQDVLREKGGTVQSTARGVIRLAREEVSDLTTDLMGGTSAPIEARKTDAGREDRHQQMPPGGVA